VPIDKVKITNFKKISETLTVTLNPGTNLLVGDNEAGKSTILEAINLALTGIFNGRYVRYEMSQYLFNRTTVNSYLDSISTDSPKSPPFIEIEIFFINAPELSTLEGNGNSEKTGHCGVLSIHLITKNIQL
jgi:putative ATP-dependent endonuclease of OLD family